MDEKQLDEKILFYEMRKYSLLVYFDDVTTEKKIVEFQEFQNESDLLEYWKYNTSFTQIKKNTCHDEKFGEMIKNKLRPRTFLSLKQICSKFIIEEKIIMYRVPKNGDYDKTQVYLPDELIDFVEETIMTCNCGKTFFKWNFISEFNSCPDCTYLDVILVVKQAETTVERAINALKEENGSLIDAILSLTM